jgi:phosphate transport system substrate-binding protein
MNRFFNALLAVCLALPVCALARERSALAGRLTIAGSHTMAPLVKEIAARFSGLHAGVQIEIVISGSGGGIAAVRDRSADIGMVSRALTENEKALFGFPIARDGAGLLVHASNPVKGLTAQQAAGVFTGRIRNWKAVGGKDLPLFTIAPPKQGGLTEPFLQALDLKAADIRPDRELLLHKDRLELMRVQPNAVALYSIGEGERLAASGMPFRLLAIDGVEASGRTIMSGDYAMSRALLLVTSSLPRGLGRAFIDYASSAQVADLVEKFDFHGYRE